MDATALLAVFSKIASTKSRAEGVSESTPYTNNLHHGICSIWGSVSLVLLYRYRNNNDVEKYN